LNEDDEVTVERPVIVDGTPKKIQQNEARKVNAAAALATSGGMSMVVKIFLILGVILGCVGFVKMYSPRKSSVAGRHGAYVSRAYP